MKKELYTKDKTAPKQFLKIAPFKKNIRKTLPHKHNNYFEIVYLTQGKGTHTIDATDYKINSPVIFNIRKEQVHFWNITSEPVGYVLILKKEFIEQCLDLEVKPLIAKLSTHNCLYPVNTDASIFFKLLEDENKKESSVKGAIINGLLKALLAKLLEIPKHTAPKKYLNNIYSAFINNLSSAKNLTNSVTYYANLLHTTPQNLNAICRKENDKTATEILSEYIINEAKRQLIYTDYTVAQIAINLNFKDNSHFSKYFKRHCSTTPAAFRKVNI
ncbi:helix-turn-helix domain-containing protein [Cellulophaga lytica]|nr:helix-turn-helix domain-containing protein [Cellulophaga lytica]